MRSELPLSHHEHCSVYLVCLSLSKVMGQNLYPISNCNSGSRVFHAKLSQSSAVLKNVGQNFLATLPGRHYKFLYIINEFFSIVSLGCSFED